MNEATATLTRADRERLFTNAICLLTVGGSAINCIELDS
ncbi:MAG: hypothetical protein JWQ03_543 [Variovorax sp.]|nr:hypothetical protein [Variovorax sp.]